MIYPGGVEGVTFGSGLIGILYTSPGDKPRPTAVILHGIPGTEKNMDIAYRLRDLGWHVLLPSFSGTWGSAGDYDMTKQPEDVAAAIKFLLESGHPWQVDPARIAVIGYSLGGRAAFVAAKNEPHIGAVVSLSAITDFDEMMLSQEFYTNAAPFLRNADPRSLAAQWMRMGGANNPIEIIKSLGKPALILHGTSDDVVPTFLASALFEASGGKAQLVLIEEADHYYTGRRVRLVDEVTGWLQRWQEDATDDTNYEDATVL